MEDLPRLDTLDKRIIRALQVEGRASYDELAARVNLSPSATLCRVKRLEAAGVIAGYVALELVRKSEGPALLRKSDGCKARDAAQGDPRARLATPQTRFFAATRRAETKRGPSGCHGPLMMLRITA